MTTTVTLDERPTWRDVALSFVPSAKRTERAQRLLDRVPLGLILLIQVGLTWRLFDVASDDEALYINVGHDVIQHLLHGGAIANYGTYLSGAPAGYPVVAAGLDSVGGLILVRMFSLLCILGCTICVNVTATRLFGRRAGLFAALVFVLSGSVLFIGKLATYDAPCLFLIAVALAISLTRKSVLSGVGVGGLLALAATIKYVGIGFAPFVIALSTVNTGFGSRRELLRGVARVCVISACTATLLLGAYHLWGASLAKGLSFTTTGRRALDFQPSGTLIRAAGSDIGLLAIVAVAGAVALAARRRIRGTLIALVCLAGGAFLPLMQIRIHEFTSLDKHTAFSVLFLALPAGYALEWACGRSGRLKLATFVLVWLILIDGLWRSQLQYSWPSTITRTLNIVEYHSTPGEYFSIDGDSFRYYSGGVSGISWSPSAYAYSIIDQGTPATLAAIRSRKFAGFAYETGNVASGVLATEKAMSRLLFHDPYYQLVAKYSVDSSVGAQWYVWKIVGKD